ncbi:DNA repair protein RecN [Arcanobacterium haemolyticum]|nr:DNA repair protein RecN [Arcanobacterium haemolyticum]
MIEELRISNLGVIEEAQLALSSGLTALTGETGAGKTMAVTSLQLLLGAKADPTKVRRGADAARVEGVFSLPADSPLLDRISDAGGVFDVEGDEAVVVVSRHVPVSGRSRAYIGGRTVPTAVLADIAGSLVTVHGQSDQLRLATASEQRRALDTFGGAQIRQVREEWQAALDRFHEAEARLVRHDTRSREAARERLAMEALLSKVEEVDPQEGEEDELRVEAHRLENTESLYTAFSEAAAQLAGSDGVEFPALSGIEIARRALDEADDDDLHSLIDRLDSVHAELSDIAAELADRAAHTEADPERLQEIYGRRQQLSALRKELAMDIDEIRRAAQEARETLNELGDPEGTRAALVVHRDEAHAVCVALAEQLHDLRVSAAKELAARVNAELPELSLADARVEILVEAVDEWSASGADAISFLMASHAAAPLAPLGNGASGGELSRVMLAVEVSLASGEHDTGHTFLFDEVDAGVGGRAAVSVGKRLAKLAQQAQVLVVTHLAQVAAFARTQAVVVKTTEDGSALTNVVEVDGDERLAELARMLSGSDSDTARAHAAELLSNADMAL